MTGSQLIPVPAHWIGVWKHWEDISPSIAESLVEITPSDLSTHALVIGATGAGKTNALHHLIAGDLLRGTSIVILDARGDLAWATLELAARAGMDPALIRFFDLRERGQPLGFNPLAGAGEPYYRAFGLLDAVAAESESWGVQLAETFRNAALLLAETECNLTQLEKLLLDSHLRNSLIARTKSDSLRAFWNRYHHLSPDRQSALASPVLNKVSALVATEGLRRMFSHPVPVDIGQCLRTPGSITLVSLAVDELHSAGWMVGSLLLSSICREIFSQVGIPESQRNAVRLYVDEFEHFGTHHFETILAEGRRFRLSTVLAHQTLAQLSPKIRSLVLGNVGVKLVFRTSHADAEILNRDLTGTKGAFSLASLQVGEAILWRRGDNPWPIEINAPLICDVGRASRAAQELQAQLIDQASAYFEVVEPIAVACPEPPAEPKNPKRTESTPRVSVRAQSLEDWLN